MLHHAVSFSVTIEDVPRTLPNGLECAQTAVIGFRDAHQKIFETIELGVVPKNQLYATIASGQPIKLKHAYINGFSLAEYREQHQLASTDEVELVDFSADHCFFDHPAAMDLSYARLTGSAARFNGTVFSSEVDFLRARFSCEEAQFGKVRFHGNANFQYCEMKESHASFAGAVFEGEAVSFVNADLGRGRTDFSNTRFVSEEVSFQFARFREGDTTFDRAFFQCDKISFGKCEFGPGKVDFRLVHFGHADIDFSECTFEAGRVRFRRSEFGNGNISFAGAMFGKAEVTFERSNFGSGKLSFANASGKTLNLADCVFSGLVDLRVGALDAIDLSETTSRDLLDLKPEEGESQVKAINFSGLRNLGRISIDWTDNRVPHLIYDQPNTSIKQKADQFRLLKEEFHQAGQYNEEDRAYVHFKRLEWQYETARALKRAGARKPIVWSQQLFKKLVFDWIGHYATNPIRVLGSMVLAFVAFSVLFVGLEVAGLGSIDSSLGDPDGLNMVEKAFYHSAITFLTIGYGDYYPSGIIRLLSGLEGFVGLFLLSYFTVAFVRKILR